MKVFTAVKRWLCDITLRKLVAIFLVLIFLAAVGVQQVYYSVMLGLLTEASLKEIGSSLERDSKSLASDMFSIYSVTSVIRTTEDYQKIEPFRNESLPTTHYMYLTGIRESIANISPLYQAMEICQVFFPGCNAVSGSLGHSGDLRGFLTNTLVFRNTQVEDLVEALKERRSVRLLPLEEVSLLNREPEWYLPVIACNSDASISVLSLMHSDKVLSYFNVQQLAAEGMYLRIVSDQGEVVMSYPEAIPEDQLSDGYLLTGAMSSVQARVELLIPRSYFLEQTETARLRGLELLLLIVALGFVMILYLPSRVARVFTTDDKGVPMAGGSDKDRNMSLLHHRVGSNLLLRVITGSVLGEEEEQTLRTTVLSGVQTFYILIVQSNSEVNAAISSLLIPEDLGGSLVSTGESEVGIFLPGDEDQLEILLERLDSFRVDIGEFCCGISTPCQQSEEIYTAVRQARNAIPRNPGVRRYVEESFAKPLNRMLYERLFQSMVSLKDESFQKTFDEIWQQSTLTECQDTFYNIRFMLRNAVEELDVADLVGSGPNYEERLSLRENVHELREYTRQVFACAQERKNMQVNNRKNGILAYVQNNAFNSELCAALVAEKQGISERRVYDIVREMTGMTFNNYLTTLRMKRVGQLLYATDLSIWEVAQRCGYQSESTFYRTFHKFYGVSPSAYRSNEEHAGIPDQPGSV